MARFPFPGTPARRRPWLGALLGLALLASLALNLVLFQQASGFYALANAIRLDPLGLDRLPPDVRRPDTQGRPLAVFLGDSRAESWPAPEGRGDMAFINRGVDGQTTAQILARFDAHLPALRPDWVILQAGINDLKTLPLFPWREREIVARTQANLAALVQRSRALGARVVLTTVFPAGAVPLARRPFWSPAVARAVAEVNAQLRRLAGPDVLVLDGHALLSQDGQARAAYYLDTLHLNPRGYAALNQALSPLLARGS